MNVTSTGARTKMAANGRIVVPAAMRRQLGLRAGDEVMLRVEDGELRVYTLASALKRIRRENPRYFPPGVSLVDELIADRRAEAAREQTNVRQRPRTKRARGTSA